MLCGKVRGSRAIRALHLNRCYCQLQSLLEGRPTNGFKAGCSVGCGVACWLSCWIYCFQLLRWLYSTLLHAYSQGCLICWYSDSSAGFSDGHTVGNMLATRLANSWLQQPDKYSFRQVLPAYKWYIVPTVFHLSAQLAPQLAVYM